MSTLWFRPHTNPTWGASLALLAVLGACSYLPPPDHRPTGGGLVGIGGTHTSPFAPLTADEQALCTLIATQQAFKDTLGQDRYLVLSQIPVYRRSGTSLPRTCKIEIFDYTKNLDLQATIDLSAAKVVSSRQLKDVQPAVGEAEIAMARGVAEAAAEPRARLHRIFNRPLENLEVTAMVRTDGRQCRTHRCIELDFYETGPEAGSMQAAEPTNAQVTWRPVKYLGRVIVDLSQIAVVSLEVVP